MSSRFKSETAYAVARRLLIEDFGVNAEILDIMTPTELFNMAHLVKQMAWHKPDVAEHIEQAVQVEFPSVTPGTGKSSTDEGGLL